MEPKITVNGVDYASVEDMPAEVRQVYEKALGQTRAQFPGLDVTLAESHTMQRGGTVKQSFVVNGKTYADESAMPAEVREQYEKAMSMLKSGDPKVTRNEVKLTFQVQGPNFRFGKSVGSAPPSSSALSMPVPIEPSSVGSSLRFLVAAVAFVAGGFVVWLLMRPR